MKKIRTLLILLAFVGLSMSSAWAQGGTTGPLTWNLNNGTLTISGVGKMPDYGQGAPWFPYRENITAVVIQNGVTTIGNQAFSYCTALASVTLPNSVSTIGYRAFYYCTALASVTLPNSVITIGEWTFYYCTALASVTNLNPVPVKISAFVFNIVNINACTLKVPASSVAAYQNAAVWQEFNPIVGIEVGIETFNPETTTTLHAYPNPTNGILHVTSVTDVTNVLNDIDVFDMYGRVVETRHAVSLQNAAILDISHLPAGIYFLRVGNETVKVVKE